MVDYQTLSIVLTGIGMIIALTYYGLQIRNQNKTRQAQLFMNLYDTYHSPEFRVRWHELLQREWTDNEDWSRKYGQNSEHLAAYTSMLSFFNGIGVLLKRNLISLEMVDDLLSVNIRGFWKMFESTVYWARERIDEPKMYADFEYLYHEVMKINEKAPDFRKFREQ